MSNRCWCRSSKHSKKVAARRRYQARVMAALIYSASNTRRAQQLPVTPHRQVQPAALDFGVSER